MGDEDDVTIGKDQAEAEARAPSRAQGAFQINMNYEFSAPHYFDFVQGETSEEAHEAECWFETACTNAASRRRILLQDGTGAPSEKNKALILTIPKDQRSQPTRFKSTDELEEEMPCKIPKFKARPFNKKILEAPLLLPLRKTVPQLSEFQEFHLKRMERSLQHSSTDSAVIPDKRPCKSITGVVLKPWKVLLRACPPK